MSIGNQKKHFLDFYFKLPKGSESEEKEAREYLRTLIEHLLSKYPRTMEEDMQLLGTMTFPEDENSMNCLNLIIGEKKILMKHLAFVKNVERFKAMSELVK